MLKESYQYKLIQYIIRICAKRPSNISLNRRRPFREADWRENCMKGAKRPCNFHDKGQVRLKRLLGDFHFINFFNKISCKSLRPSMTISIVTVFPVMEYIILQGFTINCL